MENKKDIGKAISDKLSSLDKTPRENVWSGISYELQKKKKRRIGFFFFWTKAIGLLLIGAIGAYYIYTQNNGFNTDLPKNSNESIIVNENSGKTNTNNSKEENTEIKGTESGLNNGIATEDENSIQNKNVFENKTNLKNRKDLDNGNSLDNNGNSVNSKTKKGSSKATRNNNSVSKTAKAFTNKSSQISKTNTKKTNKTNKGKFKKANEASTPSEINTEQNTTALFDTKSLQNNGAIDETKEINSKKTDSLVAKKEKEKKKNVNMYPEDKTEKDSAKGFVKFHVDVFVSPTYYGYFSNNSTLSRFLNSNSKTTEIELNYGAGLTYELTEKAAIRIGYNSVKLNYTTHDALVNTQNYSGIKYIPNINNETIYTASNNAETMDITQNMSYNEITLEGRYKILDKKIGINGIVGFSFLMLNDNTVNIKTSNGFGQEIGQTKGLFETGASANIGFGLDYPVFKNTKVFLEPMFNYQGMTFDNSNYKPYYFGLHFGIRYALIDK